MLKSNKHIVLQSIHNRLNQSVIPKLGLLRVGGIGALYQILISPSYMFERVI